MKRKSGEVFIVVTVVFISVVLTVLAGSYVRDFWNWATDKGVKKEARRELPATNAVEKTLR